MSVAVQGPGKTVALAGSSGSTTIAAWGEGHAYSPQGPTDFEGFIRPNDRPANLVANGKYYERSKPQYEDVPLTGFLSARTLGATGDGDTDDTFALQSAIFAAAKAGQILFVNAGTYKVTKTIYIPSGAKIVGEVYPVIMSSGSFFNNMDKPQPVVQVGRPGEKGEVEW